MKAKQEQAADYLRAHQALCRAENAPGEEMITEALSWLEDLRSSLDLATRAQSTAASFQAVAESATAAAKRAQADRSRLTSELIAARDTIEAARRLLSR